VREKRSRNVNRRIKLASRGVKRARPNRVDRVSTKAACYFSVYQPPWPLPLPLCLSLSLSLALALSLSHRQQIADLIGREKSKSFRALSPFLPRSARPRRIFP